MISAIGTAWLNKRHFAHVGAKGYPFFFFLFSISSLIDAARS
jgi:hypothetical protein